MYDAVHVRPSVGREIQLHSKNSNFPAYYAERPGRGWRLGVVTTSHPGASQAGTGQIRLRPGHNLTYCINTPGEFLGTIRNRDAIGKMADEAVTTVTKRIPASRFRRDTRGSPRRA